jgi:tetratricopeptide (TPR) repeat protein
MASAILGLVCLIVAGSWHHSRRPEQRYRRARQALEAGDSRTVFRESQCLLKTSGYEPHGRLLCGLLHARSGKYVKALYELQFAARDDTTAVEALTVAAECYLWLGRLVEAIQTARAAIARDAGALEARRLLASAYYDLGAMRETVAELEELSLRAADDGRPEYLLGLIERDRERFQNAIVHYRESLRRNPRQANRETVRFELADSLVKVQCFDEALGVLDQCSRTAPTLTLIAECHHSLGRTDEARSLLQSARNLDPTYAPACLQLGVLFLLMRQVGDAIGVLEDAVRLAPQNSQARYYLSVAYARNREYGKSADELRIMNAISAAEREFSELHTVASQNPDDPDVRYRIGVLARKLEKYDLAGTWFRAALALRPDDALAGAALAELNALQEAAPASIVRQ